MQALHAIGGANEPPVSPWEGEDRHSFREVRGHPSRQAGSALLVFLHRLGQICIGRSSVWSLEDSADVLGYFGLHLLMRHISLRILLQMEPWTVRPPSVPRARRCETAGQVGTFAMGCSQRQPCEPP